MNSDNKVQLNEHIDELTRLAYLDAMGVTTWVPKNDLTIGKDTQPEELSQPKTEEQVVLLSDSNVESIKLEMVKQPEVESHSHSSEGSKLSVEPEENDREPQVFNSAAQNSHQITTEKTEIIEGGASKHFLKLVNWANPVLSESTAKTLLIICRHQVDQPANSFARVNGPSQFMMDYINTLSSLAEGKSDEYRIQLAHLSAAGLSEECVPLSKVMETTAPELVLILGEDTVDHLLDVKSSVADLRGQLNKIEQRYQSLASYHPFSLIQNPSLKRLAYEDLVLVSDILSLEK